MNVHIFVFLGSFFILYSGHFLLLLSFISCFSYFNASSFSGAIQ